MTRVTRAERRGRVEQILLADHAQADRAVARASAASHTLVATIRRELETAGKIAPRTRQPEMEAQPNGGKLRRQPAGEPGPAMTHGAYSAAKRAPLEAEHRDRLRRAYPHAPDDLVNSAAKRASMIDLFSAWIEDAGAVHAVKGQPTVSDPARELRRLLNDHEGAIERLEARGGGAGRHQTLAEIERELPDEDEDTADGGEGS